MNFNFSLKNSLLCQIYSSISLLTLPGILIFSSEKYVSKCILKEVFSFGVRLLTESFDVLIAGVGIDDEVVSSWLSGWKAAFTDIL